MINKVCTLYYNTEIDSQRLNHVEVDSYRYIKPWYESVMKLNLNGVVFYDNLSERFVKKYSNGNIEFIKFDPMEYKSKFKYEMEGFNDGRFPLYYDYLKKTNMDNVFFTDCHDVRFNLDMFNGMESVSEKLFCGSERTSFSGNGWLIKKFNVFNDSSCKNIYEWYNNNMKRKTLSAGIIGGSRENVLRFLCEASETHWKLEINNVGKYNLNMAIFNYIVYNLNIPFVTGYPVHNLYKQSDKRTDVWITHK